MIFAFILFLAFKSINVLALILPLLVVDASVVKLVSLPSFPILLAFIIAFNLLFISACTVPFKELKIRDLYLTFFVFTLRFIFLSASSTSAIIDIGLYKTIFLLVVILLMNLVLYILAFI